MYGIFLLSTATLIECLYSSTTLAKPPCHEGAFVFQLVIHIHFICGRRERGVLSGNDSYWKHHKNKYRWCFRVSRQPSERTLFKGCRLRTRSALGRARFCIKSLFKLNLGSVKVLMRKDGKTVALLCPSHLISIVAELRGTGETS